MNSVVFVAARNGLGHARRLFVLALAAVSADSQAQIILTSRQVNLLTAEFDKLPAGLRLVESDELFEIDGPSFGPPSTQKIQSIPAQIAELVASSDFCISDNLIWPAKYAQRFVLLANFLWSEYWAYFSGKDLALQRQLTLESEIYSSAHRRFVNRGLVFSPSPRFPVCGEYRFLRYPGDTSLQEKVIGDEIWFSRGTTGLESTAYRAATNLQLKDPAILIERETWELTNHALAPILILGRPGIGTLRDSMAAGIPFFPYGPNCTDPELEQNAKFALNHFGVPPEWIGSRLGREGLRREILEFAHSSREKNLNNWLALSAEPDEVLDEITFGLIR